MFLLSVFTVPARGAEIEELEELERVAESYLDGYLTWSEVYGGDFSENVSKLLSIAGERSGTAVREAFRSGLLLFATALLGGLAETLRPAGGAGVDPVRFATTVCVTALAVGDVNTLMGLGQETLAQMNTFSLTLLPVMTVATSAAGAPATAVARQGAALLFFKLLLTLTERVILPLILAYIAMLSAYAALGNEGLKRVAGILKWTANGLLTLLLSGFVFYLTVTGAVAGNADALTQKAAKTALSGMVPVVGGILSDAAETVVAGAGIVKGSLGVVGLLVVLCICLMPFLRLGLHYIVYKITAALVSLVAVGHAASLVDTLSSSFALMMGAVAGGGLILYISIITSLQVLPT